MINLRNIFFISGGEHTYRHVTASLNPTHDDTGRGRPTPRSPHTHTLQPRSRSSGVLARRLPATTFHPFYITSTATTMPSDPPRRGQGVCAMRGNCGSVSRFGAQLPCPDDGDASEVSRLRTNTRQRWIWPLPRVIWDGPMAKRVLRPTTNWPLSSQACVVQHIKCQTQYAVRPSKSRPLGTSSPRPHLSLPRARRASTTFARSTVISPARLTRARLC